MTDDEPWADNVAYRLVQLGHATNVRFASKLSALGMRPRQVGVLARLEAGPMAQLELAATLGVTASVVVDMVDELELLGAVTRERDAADRRRQNVALTRRGRLLARRTRELADELDAELLDDFSPQQANRLRAALKRISVP